MEIAMNQADFNSICILQHVTNLLLLGVSYYVISVYIFPLLNAKKVKLILIHMRLFQVQMIYFGEIN